MDRLTHYALVVARVLISVVFILNSVGIIDQTIPAKELVERGAPVSMVPWMMLAGRTLELLPDLRSRWASFRAWQRWHCSPFSFPPHLCHIRSG